MNEESHDKSKNEFPLDKNQYELLHLIGLDAITEVYVARCILNSQLVCAKIFNLDVFGGIDIEFIRNESSQWGLSSHQNLVKYYGTFLAGPKIWFLTEFMDAGSMGDAIQFAYPTGIKDEVLIASVLKQVLEFLVYFHENRKIHRDIRPNTILLLSNGVVKVGSLGHCTQLIEHGQRKHARYTKFGSTIYSAPETFADSDGGYNELVDIWALGISAIEIATGKIPFSELPGPQQVQHILNDENIGLQKSDGFSSVFCSFVRDCLIKDPKKRHSAKTLLNSRFIKLDKGPDYIVSAFTSKLQPLDQRFAILHKKEEDFLNNDISLKSQNIDVSSKIQNQPFDFLEYDPNPPPSQNETKPNQDSIQITQEKRGRFVITTRKVNED